MARHDSYKHFGSAWRRDCRARNDTDFRRRTHTVNASFSLCFIATSSGVRGHTRNVARCATKRVNTMALIYRGATRVLSTRVVYDKQNAPTTSIRRMHNVKVGHPVRCSPFSPSEYVLLTIMPSSTNERHGDSLPKDGARIRVRATVFLTDCRHLRLALSGLSLVSVSSSFGP